MPGGNISSFHIIKLFALYAGASGKECNSTGTLMVRSKGNVERVQRVYSAMRLTPEALGSNFSQRCVLNDTHYILLVDRVNNRVAHKKKNYVYFVANTSVYSH